MQSNFLPDQPIRLTPEELQKPYDCIAVFFNCFDLPETREHIQNMLETAMTTDNDFYQEHTERAAIAWFCRRLEAFIEAGYVINRETRENSPQKSKI